MKRTGFHLAPFLLFAAACGSPTASEPSAAADASGEEAADDTSAEALVAQTAAGIEPHVPLALDEEKRLDAVSAEGDILHYAITLLQAMPDQFEDTDEVKEMLRATWVEKACTGADAAPLINSGATLRYDVSWQDGSDFATLDVSADDCN